MTTARRTTVDQMPGPRFPGGSVPHRDARAIYSVCRAGDELYFLNQGPDTLDLVSSCSVGSLCDGDELVGHTRPVEFDYEQVRPGEAVLLDAYDEFADSDWFYVVAIEVERGDQVEQFDVSGRGGPSSQMLKRR